MVALLLLVSCSAPPKLPTTPTSISAQQSRLWQQHQTQMHKLSAWYIKAKIAVTSQQQGGNATLIWNYQPDNQEIEIYGVFGVGRIKIAAQPSGATLKDSRGNTFHGISIAQLLSQRLGWRLPFTELRYWIRGIAAPHQPEQAAPEISLDAAGQLRTLQQNNWRVEYHQHQTVGSGLGNLTLPHTISLTSQPGTLQLHADNGDSLRVKIILKYWRALQISP